MALKLKLHHVVSCRLLLFPSQLITAFLMFTGDVKLIFFPDTALLGTLACNSSARIYILAFHNNFIFLRKNPLVKF